MEPDVFALLLGFTVAKMGIGLGIVWLGLRSGEQASGEGDDGGGGPGRPPAPIDPSRRSRRRPPRGRRRGDLRGGPRRRAARRLSV